MVAVGRHATVGLARRAVGRAVPTALALTLAAALALAAALGGGTCAVAQASSWHLVSSFGRGGAAGLPVREEGIDSIYPPGPGATGSLLAPGSSGSTIVGGYSRHSKGTFLVAQISSRGTLARSYGSGGVAAVPGIYSTPQHPPWMLAAGGGKLLVVGLDRGHDLELVRLTQAGRPDRTFAGGRGMRVPLPGTGGKAMLAAAALVHGGVLVAYYRSEAAQPSGEPQRTPGLGAGPLELVRVLAGGAVDRSFGSSGFLRTTGAPPATKEGEPAEGVTDRPRRVGAARLRQRACAGHGLPRSASRAGALSVRGERDLVRHRRERVPAVRADAPRRELLAVRRAVRTRGWRRGGELRRSR